MVLIRRSGSPVCSCAQLQAGTSHFPYIQNRGSFPSPSAPLKGTGGGKMSIPVLRLISHGALFHIASNLSAPIPVLRSQRFLFRICRHHQGKAIGFIFVEKLRRAICARDLLVTMLFSSFPKWNAVLRAPLSDDPNKSVKSPHIRASNSFRQQCSCIAGKPLER